MIARHAAMALCVALGMALGACRDAPPVARERPTPIERPVMALPSTGTRVQAPRAALIERGGTPGVFVLANGEARFRMVRPGHARGPNVEILAGLRGAETIVLGDLTEVHDGSPMTPVKPGR
jgi:hypothetical protein